MASLTKLSKYRVFVARMEELWNCMQCLWSILCLVTADLSECSSQMCH
jgi:hypothetical protein